jgi:hypothetical protein
MLLLEARMAEEGMDQPAGRKKRSKAGLLWSWLGLNLVGWMIGLYTGGTSVGVVAEKLQDVNDLGHLPDAIMQLYGGICVPLGIGLGLMQCLLMRRWKVSSPGWFFTTAAMWIFPAIAFSQIYHYVLFEPITGHRFFTYMDWLWLLYPAALLMMGVCIGLAQSLWMERVLPGPAAWMLANGLGLLAFGWMVQWLTAIPAGFNLMPMDVLIKNQGSWWMQPYALLQVIGALLPFLGALLTALPTGFVLLKYGKEPPEEAKNG